MKLLPTRFTLPESLLRLALGLVRVTLPPYVCVPVVLTELSMLDEPLRVIDDNFAVDPTAPFRYVIPLPVLINKF